MIRPPSSPNTSQLSPQTALAAFVAANATLADSQPLALFDAQGRLVHATAAALDVFAAPNASALGARLTGGEGPSARRLRHLAATLPVGAPARLERLRFTVGWRLTERNLSCARVTTQEGETLLVLWTPSIVPAATGPDPGSPTSVRAPSVPPSAQSQTAATRRFVWSLDETSRFGETDPALRAALGAAAPQSGETLEETQRRVGARNVESFAEAVRKPETFADFVLLWPSAEGGVPTRLSLSGAPIFGRSREFRGFRGFGVVRSKEEALAAEESDFATIGASSSPIIEAGSAANSDIGRAPPVSAAEDARVSESAPLPPEGAEIETNAASPANDRSAEPLRETTSADEAALAPERTAAIYVLRQTASTPVKVVPIRPAPRDAPPIDPALGSGAVELTKGERDAFREIARALVGRTPTSRYDRMPSDEPGAPRPEQEPPVEAAAPPSEPTPPPVAESDPIRRNAAALIDRLPVGVVVARGGRALYLNQTLLALLGYADFDAFHAADGLSAMFRDDDPHAITPGLGGALTIARADGETMGVDGNVQAIVWDGAPATLIALRRSAEAEMKQRLDAIEYGLARNGSASELQEMLDCATDGAVTLDASGRILSLNDPAERLFGYAEKEVAGESVLMLLAPHSHPETMTRLETLSRSEDAPPPARPLAVAGRRHDGAALALVLTLVRIGPPDALHYCALVRDLSEMREAERRLTATRDAALAASSAKTEYLAQVSHEIRTPLNAILGFAEVIMEERFGPIGNERYRDYLRDIHASGKHVISLADDLLDLAKIESGKLDLAFSAVDANAVIRECVSLMQPQATRERIIVRISLLEHLPLVMVDERSLRQIMLNLMSNAVKFNEPGGQVIISTALDAAGQAVIRVRDTGVGMNESEIGHALEPFGQVNRRGKPGAGLGLPLTKALVEANKAEFSIQSRRDHGTLIEIAFPVAQAAQ